jgi:hypothetical protein
MKLIACIVGAFAWGAASPNLLSAIAGGVAFGAACIAWMEGRK